MSIYLQPYLDSIKIMTGKTPTDYTELAITKGFFEKGVLKPTVKAGEIIASLKKDFDLGYGHSLAIYHTFKEKA